MEALEKDPPANIFNKPNNPSLACPSCKELGSTPGRTINEPILYIKRIKSVYKIRTLNSSIFQILDKVVNSFFINYNLETEPPKASIAF